MKATGSPLLPNCSQYRGPLMCSAISSLLARDRYSSGRAGAVLLGDPAQLVEVERLREIPVGSELLGGSARVLRSSHNDNLDGNLLVTDLLDQRPPVHAGK